jgi:hypothetical protein
LLLESANDDDDDTRPPRMCVIVSRVRYLRVNL